MFQSGSGAFLCYNKCSGWITMSSVVIGDKQDAWLYAASLEASESVSYACKRPLLDLMTSWTEASAMLHFIADWASPSMQNPEPANTT